MLVNVRGWWPTEVEKDVHESAAQKWRKGLRLHQLWEACHRSDLREELQRGHSMPVRLLQ